MLDAVEPFAVLVQPGERADRARARTGSGGVAQPPLRELLRQRRGDGDAGEIVVGQRRDGRRTSKSAPRRHRRPEHQLGVGQVTGLERRVDYDLVLAGPQLQQLAVGEAEPPRRGGSRKCGRGPVRAAQAGCAGARAALPVTSAPGPARCRRRRVATIAGSRRPASRPRRRCTRRGCSTRRVPSSRRPRVPLATSSGASGLCCSITSKVDRTPSRSGSGTVGTAGA